MNSSSFISYLHRQSILFNYFHKYLIDYISVNIFFQNEKIIAYEYRKINSLIVILEFEFKNRKIWKNYS